MMAPLYGGLFRKRMRPEDLLPEMFPQKKPLTKEQHAQELKEIRESLGIK